MQNLEFYQNTPLWMPIALGVITIVLFVAVISLGSAIYNENKQINNFNK